MHGNYHYLKKRRLPIIVRRRLVSRLIRWLELKPRADLDSARRGDIARPSAEVRVSDVVCEREIPADIEAARIDEVMLVEGIEELPTNLEVQSFTDPGVLDEREVHVFVVRAS